MTDQIPVVVRALRDYVASGVIWILTIWTFFSNSFGHETGKGGTLATIFKPLIPAIQNVASLIALCAIAAVLGSVSVQVFRAPAIWICNLSIACMTKAEQLSIIIASKYSHKSTVRRFKDRQPIAVDIARRYVANRQQEIEAAATSESVDVNRLREAVYHKVDEVNWQLTQSPEPSNSMITDFHGQSLFRLCLVVPLICFSFALSIRLSPGYLVLVAVPLVIAFQASDYRYQRDQLLYAEFDKSISLVQLAQKL